jgi:hypothetical protein
MEDSRWEFLVTDSNTRLTGMKLMNVLRCFGIALLHLLLLRHGASAIAIYMQTRGTEAITAMYLFIGPPS